VPGSVQSATTNDSLTITATTIQAGWLTQDRGARMITGAGAVRALV
jgi:hypothetical protein